MATSHLICATLLCLSVLCHAQEQCPIEGGGLLPHPDCTKYIQCDNGHEEVFECPGGTYFNPDAGYCDFPDNVPECVGGTRPPGPGSTTPAPTDPPTTTRTTTTTPEPTTTRTTTTTTRTTTTTTPEPTTPEQTTASPPQSTTPGTPNGCPAEGFKLIPHPDRCEKFFYCLNGEIVDEGECAEGLFFDPIGENCNFPELVNCTNPTPTTTIRTTTTTRAPLPTCPPGVIVNLPFPGNCSLYILCVHEVPILSQCANGTLFDLDSLQCKPAAEARCEDQAEEPIDASQVMRMDPMFCPYNVEFTKLPMANDCHSWYECKDGKRINSPRSCPLGLYFYFVDQTCVSFVPEHCLTK